MTYENHAADRLSRWQWLGVSGVTMVLAVATAVLAVDRIKLAWAPPPPEGPLPVKVRTLIVEPSLFERRRRYPGTLAAERQATLRSRVTGRIEALPRRTGSAVEQNETLIALDDAELRQELGRLRAQAEGIEADLRLARAQLARQESLHADDLASQNEVDEARARVETLTASRAENRQAQAVAETRLSYARIAAPFDGVVSRMHALPGDTVSPGEPLLELVDPVSLKAEFVIPQGDLARIGGDAAVTVTLSDGASLEGLTLDRLDPRLDAPGRGAAAEVLLAPEAVREAGARPGMEAVVRVRDVHQPEALQVPLEALHRDSEGPYLYVAEEEQARLRRVQAGPEAAGVVLIPEGLDAGDAVIVTPHPELAEGAPIVTERPDP